MGDFLLDGRGTAVFARVFPHLPGLLASTPRVLELEQLTAGQKWPTARLAVDGIFELASPHSWCLVRFLVTVHRSSSWGNQKESILLLLLFRCHSLLFSEFQV